MEDKKELSPEDVAQMRSESGDLPLDYVHITEGDNRQTTEWDLRHTSRKTQDLIIPELHGQPAPQPRILPPTHEQMVAISKWLDRR